MKRAGLINLLLSLEEHDRPLPPWANAIAIAVMCAVLWAALVIMGLSL